MGQKVHPYGFRLGVNKPWRSRWFSERDYDKLLIEDVKLKKELRDKLKAAGVSSVEIERPGNKLRFLIRTARPGIVIGRKGAEIEKLKTELGKLGLELLDLRAFASDHDARPRSANEETQLVAWPLDLD